MFFVGGPRHGRAFPTLARPRIDRMTPGGHPEVHDPGSVAVEDPTTFVDMVSASTYYLRTLGITFPHPLTGKPEPVAHRIAVYVHESIPWGDPGAMAAAQDAAMRWVLLTFGEEVPNPLVVEQNGNRPKETDKETPAP